MLSNIIKEKAHQCFTEKIATMQFKPHVGYICHLYGTDHEIGLELIKHGIKFQSLRDIGYAAEYDRKDPSFNLDKYTGDKKFAKSFVQSCRETPTPEFLMGAVEVEFQYEFAKRVLEVVDVAQMVKRNTFSENSSVSHVFRDLKTIGINPILINDEFIGEIKKGFDANETHPNILLNYMNQGFYFDEGFMCIFQHIHQRAFGALDHEHWLEVKRMNQENKRTDEAFKLDHCLERTTVKKKVNKL